MKRRQKEKEKQIKKIEDAAKKLKDSEFYSDLFDLFICQIYLSIYL